MSILRRVGAPAFRVGAPTLLDGIRDGTRVVCVRFGRARAVLGRAPMSLRSLSTLPILFLLSASGCAVDVAVDGPDEPESLGEVQQAITPPIGPWDVAAVELATGSNFSCAREVNGRLTCWGNNASGQLATGAAGGSSAWAKRAPAPLSIRAIGAGASHACAARSDGIVQCWGSNSHGRVGVFNPGSYPTPITVSGITGATAIGHLGSLHSCALTGGWGRCWGAGTDGQHGNGTTSNTTAAVLVAGIASFAQLESSDLLSCGRLGNGDMYCWGTGTFPYSIMSQPVTLPFKTPNVSSADSIALGTDFGCFVENGRVLCWGRSDVGQAGRIWSGSNVIAQLVPGITTAVEVVAGATHACARLSNGTMTCWGGNSQGQLGNATTATFLPPVQVSGLSGVTSMSAGGSGTCAVANPGVVYCWGNNTYGQVGDGTTISPRTTPRRVQFKAQGTSG